MAAKKGTLLAAKKSQRMGYALAFSAPEESAATAGGHFESLFEASASEAC